MARVMGAYRRMPAGMLVVAIILCLSPLSADAKVRAATTHIIRHVLVISVDGLHALDLQNYIIHHRHSVLAQLAHQGIDYTQAHTVSPADSFPGILALMTGGTPAVTGVYYDVSYDRQLSPPGSHCHRHGTTVRYDGSVDGAGAQYGRPVLNPRLLPRNPKGCTPEYPHMYLRVNTVFDVVHQAGGYTAWIDKHPVYEILNGPGGKGIDDLYTPEIGGDFEGVKLEKGKGITGSLARTERYDAIKVKALINEIQGKRHDGRTTAPIPRLFGLNLQAVNVAQKLAGYRDDNADPTPLLEAAMIHCDHMLAKIVAALRAQGLLTSTLIIISAKHGNGPIDLNQLRHINKNLVRRIINRAAPGDLAQLTTDQVALIWLKQADKTHAVTVALQRNRYRLGLRRVLYGQRLQLYFPSPRTDTRSPNLIMIPRQGVIYAGPGARKKAEHGGFSQDDTHVALLISNPGLPHRGIVQRAPVHTTQVAPTILVSLGLSPRALEAVVKQGTPVLPGENWGTLDLQRRH